MQARGRSGSLSSASPGSDSDVFPPRRSTRTSDLELPYNPDGLYEFEHEDEILFGEDHDLLDYGRLGVAPSSPNAAERDDPAWNRINDIIRQARGGRDEDEISDSESVVSVGELGEDARLGMGVEMQMDWVALKTRTGAVEGTTTTTTRMKMRGNRRVQKNMRWQGSRGGRAVMRILGR
jgi:hypothetical protein